VSAAGTAPVGEPNAEGLDALDLGGLDSLPASLAVSPHAASAVKPTIGEAAGGPAQVKSEVAAAVTVVDPAVGAHTDTAAVASATSAEDDVGLTYDFKLPDMDDL
jgi:hypothetical protein